MAQPKLFAQNRAWWSLRPTQKHVRTSRWGLLGCRTPRHIAEVSGAANTRLPAGELHRFGHNLFVIDDLRQLRQKTGDAARCMQYSPHSLSARHRQRRVQQDRGIDRRPADQPPTLAQSPFAPVGGSRPSPSPATSRLLNPPADVPLPHGRYGAFLCSSWRKLSSSFCKASSFFSRSGPPRAGCGWRSLCAGWFSRLSRSRRRLA